jgi:RimJ/RimL family protein N-acetyltransferase
VELVPYADADEHFALIEELETDPEVMRELGGAMPAEEMPRIHRRRVATVAAGDWYFVIVEEPGGPAIGTIGVWEKELDGATVHETGWMVLPAHQGRGIASAALAVLIERARADERYPSIHAFPPVTNAPSNALCRKFGFELVAERDFVYAGRTLRCNHWALDTSS